MELKSYEIPSDYFQEVDYLFGIRFSWEFNRVASFLIEKVGLPSNPDTHMSISPVHEIVLQIEDWSINASRFFGNSSLDGSSIRSVMTRKNETVALVALGSNSFRKLLIPGFQQRVH